MSAYRVVQEALTNALKHGDGPVPLAVDADDGRLRIPAPTPAGSSARCGSGLGLQGMAERVGLLGGRLRARPTPDGRFARRGAPSRCRGRLTR